MPWRRTSSDSKASSAASSDPGSIARSEREYASPSTGAGGLAFWRMPSAAEMTRAAIARYGLASAPGLRHSIRDSSDRFDLIARTAVDRFSNPQLTLVGAK